MSNGNSNGVGELDIDASGGVGELDSIDVELAGVAADFNAWRKDQGIGGSRVYARGGRKRIRTISVSDEAYNGLKYLAQANGTYFGDNVSVSALLEAVGTFQLRLTQVE